MSKTLWLFRNTVSFSAGWYPQWDMRQMSLAELRTNGWTPGWRCLDMTLRIYRLNLNATFWNLPNWKERY